MEFGEGPAAASLQRMWDQLEPIGRDPGSGGYRRLTWSPADAALREWFTVQARERDLDLETDRNGNMFAWWGGRGPGAVLTGSHLDSVLDGGAFDGPLGVMSGLAAIDLLRARAVSPDRPVGVAVFTEEEGTRFGLACLGTKLLTGTVDPDTARSLTDAAGTTFASAMAQAGLDPEQIGPDADLIGRISMFIELHIEQGRGLADLDAAIGLAEQIWPHGRWRIQFTGHADHAGTTRLADRRDPMLTFAGTVLAARHEAHRFNALATFGKIDLRPCATNVIPGTLLAWLDARAPDQGSLDRLVEAITVSARESARAQRIEFEIHRESYSDDVVFDPVLRSRLSEVLSSCRIKAATLPTGAGHDAGVLSGKVATAMLFVRNPTGVSHAPGEYAEPADCVAGVEALAAILQDAVTPRISR
ncbi:MAG TPA: allantoate amidohydrolase [Streptosporangiaceae bacterium]|jgi:N-carbamoyl-L-amino-acid hydrolase